MRLNTPILGTFSEDILVESTTLSHAEIMMRALIAGEKSSETASDRGGMNSLSGGPRLQRWEVQQSPLGSHTHDDDRDQTDEG